MDGALLFSIFVLGFSKNRSGQPVKADLGLFITGLWCSRSRKDQSEQRKGELLLTSSSCWNWHAASGFVKANHRNSSWHCHSTPSPAEGTTTLLKESCNVHDGRVSNPKVKTDTSEPNAPGGLASLKVLLGLQGKKTRTSQHRNVRKTMTRQLTLNSEQRKPATPSYSPSPSSVPRP